MKPKERSRVKASAKTGNGVATSEGDTQAAPKRGRTTKKPTSEKEELNSNKMQVDDQTNIEEFTKSRRNTRLRNGADKAKTDGTDLVTEVKGTSRKRKAAKSPVKVEDSKELLSDVKLEENNRVPNEAPPSKKLSARSKTTTTSRKLETSVSEDVKVEAKIKIEKPFTLGRKCVGGHTSIAGGIHNSIIEATKMGGNAFAMFVRSQRQWNCKPMEDAAAEKFRATLVEHNFPPNVVLPHGSYLLNCGAPNPETLEKSRAGIIDELQRCEKLGLVLYNFHPGSTCGKISIDECLDKIAESINLAHAATKNIIVVIENMSRQGHTIGGDFQELAAIIDRVNDKSRVGVCIDTCHAFAAGYDLASEKGYNLMMGEFEKYIGFQYLKGLHLNDSKGPVGCHKDRHENIGKGHIGIEGFRRIMNEPRFNDLPMILETPWVSDDIYMKECKLLNSLIGT